MGLVRMSLPEGKILDKIDMTDAPLSTCAPCWFPGTLARVLCSGGDGRIYRVDFETPLTDGRDEHESMIRPRALTWRTPGPAPSTLFVGDLSWPTDERMGHRILASLYIENSKTEKEPDWRIWWLQLDQAATSIIAAGPLLEPETSGEEDNRRLPNLVRNENGSLALTYLNKGIRQPNYELRLAPIHLEPGSNVPHALETEARVLASGCLLVSPLPSPDGRWVTVVRSSGRIERLAIRGEATLLARYP